MTEQRVVIVERAAEPQRGPGGHYYIFVARYVDDDGTRGWGQTTREAELTLRRMHSAPPGEAGHSEGAVERPETAITGSPAAPKNDVGLGTDDAGD